MNIHLPELKATNKMAIKSNTNCESTKPLPTELKINMCGHGRGWRTHDPLWHTKHQQLRIIHLRATQRIPKIHVDLKLWTLQLGQIQHCLSNHAWSFIFIISTHYSYIYWEIVSLQHTNQNISKHLKLIYVQIMLPKFVLDWNNSPGY